MHEDPRIATTPSFSPDGQSDPRIPRPPTSPRGLDRNVPAYVLYEENNPARVTYSALCVPLALLFADAALRFAQ